jgi:peptidoglycan/LPS O-acetylase OafA/YrhL
MWKFALAAFVPAYFAGYAIAEPGRYRATEGLGAGLGFLAIGLIIFYLAIRNGSPRPGLWGGAFMIATFGLAMLGSGQ